MRQMRAVIKLPLGLFEAARIIRSFKPDLVVGMGGYSAGPLALAAWFMGIPVVLHEQNVLPGITNRILARIADRVYVSFEKTRDFVTPAKTRVTGNPVRKEILEMGRQKSSPGNKTGGTAFTVLIAGGSQGAHALNLAVTETAKRIPDPGAYRFIHQTGVKDENMVKKAYQAAGCRAEVKPFFKNMGDRYRKADLVICRAGATTVAEVAALGKAVLFVPFPHAADNHQEINARSLSDSGAAETILEKDLNAERLISAISYYQQHARERERMGASAMRLANPRAAADIVDDCYRLIDGPHTAENRPASVKGS
jgi:UDP-N-acetylglucosamine--N-acetylmuramyl-(pentapeptide) pyrophosphoryl-undecaprenol N-acetylglucosamine transferase